MGYELDALTTLQIFIQSNAWDPRYNLPTAPMHNNPAIYSAYARKLIGPLPLKDDVYYQENALTLFESKNIDTMSHDEKIGYAFISEDLARRVLEWEIVNGSIDERFPFYIPFLKARAGYKVGVISAFLWTIHYIFSAITFKNDGTDFSGYLKNWLMLDDALKTPFAWIGAEFWRAKMRRLGVTPHVAFTTYLWECPAFLATAPDSI